MPDDTTQIARLIGGAADARTTILDEADAGPAVLVAAALVRGDTDLLARAAGKAMTSRDRQLATIAAAHLADDTDLLDALVRDHLADHPDSVIAAWIAGRHQAARTARNPVTNPDQE